MTTACATPGQPPSTASTSPGSIRNPRILTCSSARPANTSSPPAVHRARSPVRYIRSPPDPNGHAVNRSAVSAARPRYPRASPAPATYSSPVTPAGTGFSHRSSTNTRVPSSGRPIGSTPGTCPAEDTARCTAHSVISVGPYSCRTVTPAHAASTARTAPAGTTSPPVRTSRSPAKHPGSDPASTRRSPAVTWTCVRPAPATSRRTPAPSSSPAGATTTRPPPASTTHSSSTDASNACGACHSTRPEPAPPQHPSATSAPTPACATTTPLGTPVDPDVYITYAGYDGSTGASRTGAAGADPSRVITGMPSGTGSPAASDLVASTHAGAASASMSSIRPAG